MLDIKQTPEGVTFKIRVQPKSSRNKLDGLYQDGIKVRLTAPPVDGEANQACLEFFAKLFGVSKSRVHLVSGHTGRSKVIQVLGITAEQARAVLETE
ncbi:MAG TPA: DUF167 domain-containing protein [Bacillota bacterium]|nr:DUF167 domain-containing protein [Bacillota bacterium]